MTKWADIQWFTGTTSAASGTTVVDAGELGTSSSPWTDSSASSHSSESSTTDPTGGSGSTPSITIGIDYWLRDENGEVITDELGAGYSLEGSL